MKTYVPEVVAPGTTSPDNGEGSPAVVPMPTSSEADSVTTAESTDCGSVEVLRADTVTRIAVPSASPGVSAVTVMTSRASSAITIPVSNDTGSAIVASVVGSTAAAIGPSGVEASTSSAPGGGICGGRGVGLGDAGAVAVAGAAEAAGDDDVAGDADGAPAGTGPHPARPSASAPARLVAMMSAAELCARRTHRCAPTVLPTFVTHG